MSDMTGITERRTASGVRRFRAQAWDNAQGRNIYETFPTAVAARAWRREMQGRIVRGEVRAAEPTTIAKAYEHWIAKAQAGEVRSRGGTEYKPSVLHGYAITFESRLLAEFGRVKVGTLRRVSIQRYVDRLVAEGLAAQTIKNIVTALRVLLKWCVREELIQANPCDGLELPAGGETRDRIASVAEALELVNALPDARDRAIMATAFFSGLRRGELMGLPWVNVHLVEHRIEVRTAYDPRTKTFGLPKSSAGFRIGENAPGIPEALWPYLMIGGDGEDLVFGDRPANTPFNPTMLMRRCMAAWGWYYIPKNGPDNGRWIKDREDALEPIGLHECRHTYASICIAAGINIKTLSTWMGHSSITITLDRYGHLLPGSTKEALGLLNAHLTKETTS